MDLKERADRGNNEFVGIAMDGVGCNQTTFCTDDPWGHRFFDWGALHSSL